MLLKKLIYTLYVLKIKIDLHIYGEIKIGRAIKIFRAVDINCCWYPFSPFFHVVISFDKIYNVSSFEKTILEIFKFKKTSIKGNGKVWTIYLILIDKKFH